MIRIIQQQKSILLVGAVLSTFLTKKRNVSARCLKELKVKQFNLRKKLIDVLHEAYDDGLWIDLIQEELKLLSSEEFIVCDGFDCDGKPI